LWLLRAVVTVHLAGVVCQPVLAGMFLTGDVDAIALHATIANVLAVVDLLVIAAALLYLRGGRGKRWVLPVAVLLFVTVSFQITMGYARQLQLHIPLGVAITTGSVLLAVWVWSPSAAGERDGGR
jgi:hypothetical protein